MVHLCFSKYHATVASISMIAVILTPAFTISTKYVVTANVRRTLTRDFEDD